MSEEKPGTKKTVVKKADKATASAANTPENTSVVKQPEEIKAPEKKAAVKKAPVKKATADKTPANKAAASKKTAVAKAAAQAMQSEQDIVPTLQSIVTEMSRDRDSRDNQISSLIQEVREGFSVLSERTSKQGSEHEKEMTGLYQTLHNVFGKIKDNSEEREERNLEIFKSLSEVIMKDHEQTLKEVHEQEILQDKKIKLLDQVQEQRSGRNRLIAIPGVIIAITGIIYMFYVVSIMETAMTNMSHDMHNIQLSVGGMTSNIGTISQDTTSMSSNMQQLNGNTQQMSRDLNVMTNNVAPAMKGMRDVMPWAP
jgi:uncharacterized protein YoxC